MQAEANPVLQILNFSKSMPPQNSETDANKQNESTKENNSSLDMRTRFSLLKKMKSDLEEIRKKESRIVEDDDDQKDKNTKKYYYNYRKDNILKTKKEKSRKKMILEKYENVNGKKSEVIKERNESEEESIAISTPLNLNNTSESNEEENSKESSNVKDVNELNEGEKENDKKEKLKQALLRLTFENKNSKEKMQKARSDIINYNNALEDEKEKIENEVEDNINSDNNKSFDKEEENFQNNDNSKYSREEKNEKNKENDIIGNNSHHNEKKSKKFYEIGNIFETLKEQHDEKKKNTFEEQKMLSRTNENLSNYQVKESKTPEIIDYRFSELESPSNLLNIDKKDKDIQNIRDIEKDIQVVNCREKDIQVVNNREEEIPFINNREKDIQVINNWEKDIPVINNREKDIQVTNNREKYIPDILTREKDIRINNSREKDIQVTNSREKDISVNYHREKDIQVNYNREKDIQVNYNREKDIQIINTRPKDIHINNNREKDIQVINIRQKDFPVINIRDKEIHNNFQNFTHENSIINKDIQITNNIVKDCQLNNSKEININQPNNKEFPIKQSSIKENNIPENAKKETTLQTKNSEETNKENENKSNQPLKNTTNLDEMSFKDKLNRLKKIQPIEQDLKNLLKTHYEQSEEEKREDQKWIEETRKKKLEEKRSQSKQPVKVLFPENSNISQDENDFLPQRNDEEKRRKDQEDKKILEKQINEYEALTSNSNLKTYEKKFHHKKLFSNQLKQCTMEDEEEKKRKIFTQHRNFSLESSIYKSKKVSVVQSPIKDNKDSNNNLKDVYKKPLNSKKSMEPKRPFQNPSNIIYNPKKPPSHKSKDKISQISSKYEKGKFGHNQIIQSSYGVIPSTSLANQKDPYPANKIFKSQSSGKYIRTDLQKNIEKFQINLEDFLILEEKLNDIILSMNLSTNLRNECFDWWVHIFNSSIYPKIEELFQNDNSIRNILKFELLSILICYDVSLNRNVFQDFVKIYEMLKEILNLNYKNLIIICDYILSKISCENMNNIWVFKVRSLVNSSKANNFSLFDDNITPKDKIIINSNKISRYINIILKNYPENKKSEKLITLYKTIEQNSYQDIKFFFQEEILFVDNPNGSVLAAVALRENGKFKTEDPPYLKTKNLKPYSLILDLDETIIHFKVDPNNDQIGVLRERPGLINFLESIKNYYEIIIFTAATQDYADILIDEIEENKIYFDYRLYRQHTIIVENDFVKDLSRIGRPLNKIVIVDNMPQNFRLQKENGIIIKAFWGEDSEDRALFDLKDILISIAREGGDVRKSLSRYKDEILRKITSNMSRQEY